MSQSTAVMSCRHVVSVVGVLDGLAKGLSTVWLDRSILTAKRRGSMFETLLSKEMHRWLGGVCVGWSPQISSEFVEVVLVVSWPAPVQAPIIMAGRGGVGKAKKYGRTHCCCHFRRLHCWEIRRAGLGEGESFCRLPPSFWT